MHSLRQVYANEILNRKQLLKHHTFRGYWSSNSPNRNNWSVVKYMWMRTAANIIQLCKILFGLLNIVDIVIDVRKMGDIVRRTGLKPTSLAFWAIVIPLHHVGSVMSPLYLYLLVHAAPCLRGQFRLLNSSPWNCKSFNAYNYVHTGKGLAHMYVLMNILFYQQTNKYIHTQGMFDNHTVFSLYRILVIAPVSWVWWKLEILYLEWGSNPHLWHFRPACYHYTM